uniref:LRAT domain-containing protein n=1 Tax=Noccaea caerulescens TaxID=107243 RepID=A0A1J3H3Y7_NOCCA
MGLLSNKISRDDLKPGDHIYSWRSYIYSHHGIYLGDGKVIHFTRGDGLEIGTGTFLDNIIVSSVPNHGGDNPCPDCGDQSNLDGVISSCLDCFLSGGNLYLFEYNVSKAIFLAKHRGGTCTIAPSDPSEQVISRAKFLLARNGFGHYDLLENNCEDFAIYCKTGLLVLSITKLGSSGQVNSICAAGGVVSLTLKVLGVGKTGGQAASMAASQASMVSAASNVLSSTIGYVATGVGALALTGYGNYCIGRLVYDVGVRKDVRKVPVEELVVIVQAMKGGKLDNNNNVCKTA